jgi:formamidopyrimidine-DNA glycosylase
MLEGASGAELKTALAGNQFLSSRRHGKHLLVKLERSGWLMLHFGLTGALELFDRRDEEPKYTRMRVDFIDGGSLAYTSVRMLGRIGLTEDPGKFLRDRAVGLDVLDRRFDIKPFMNIFSEAEQRGSRLKKPIKAILMDQSLMAGIGNIYSDEILFQARVYPLTPGEALTAEQLKTIFRSIGRVLRTAIDCRAGSERFVERLPRGYLLRQRNRGGECPRCATNFETYKLAGRTGYYCPRCQKRN